MATKKLKEEQAKAVDEAKASADELGTGNPVLAPETSNVPEPGTTSSDPGEVDVVNTDDAKSLQPNVTVSGTKPDGQGGQVLLDTVDPAVANAALIPDTAPPEPKSPAKAPEQTGPKAAEGEVLFRCTADNGPFFSGGEMKANQSYVMPREEAELLASLNAGQIEGGSDSNAVQEGSDK
jgi:hypothetical protein